MTKTTMIDVTLHDVGEGLAEAEIIEWLVAPGQAVTEDQMIVVISTDKASVELPAPASGILREQAVPVGTTVAVGTLLARIEVAECAAEKLAGGAAQPVAPAVPSQPEQPSEQRIPFSRARLAIARAVAAAWREVPHIVEFRQIDATELQRARHAYRVEAERQGLHLTYLPFFAKAASIALMKHPGFNASVDMSRGEAVHYRHCHIGIATASDAGLLVPVLRNAETLSIMELARALDALVDRAKRQTLSADDLTAGTCTITNFGSYGTWLGTPIIRSPEVAIIGFGRIQPGVLAVGEVATVLPVLPICVATDHRINDGVHLAGFLDTLTDALSNPAAFSMHPLDGGAHG